MRVAGLRRQIHRRAILRQFVGTRLTKPARIVHTNCLTVGHQGVTTIKLEGGLFALPTGIDDLAGEGLDHRRGQHISQLGQMGAALWATQAFAHSALEPAHQIQTLQPGVAIAMLVAVARIGHGMRFGTGPNHVEVSVHYQPKLEIMDGRTSRPQAVGTGNVAGLGVLDAGLDFPKTVTTRKRLHRDASLVLQLAGGVGWRQRHRTTCRAVDQYLTNIRAGVPE